MRHIPDDDVLFLITCSGISNTGKLTAQVAAVLIQREPDLFEGHLHGKQSTHDIMENVINDGKVLVLDGCKDHCAAKKLKSLSITPHIHIIATEEGIEKNGMADPRFDEIEKLVAAVRKAVRQ
ncbi:MAG: putative zinc-binding protein [Methanomicrobiales archaeon]